jgi:TonB family protein
VGEDHPLRKSFRRTFIWSATIAMLIHAAVAGGRIVVAQYLESRIPPPTRVVKFIPIDTVVPPSITQEETPPDVALADHVAQPTAGIPEPVPDYEATELTVASTEEMSAQTSDLSALTGGADSVVVNFEGGLPSPDEYVAVEEMPQLINVSDVQRATADLYPEIAKSAGVEGTVNLKVYVGKNGDVEKVLVVDGPEMLRQAAMDAVKKAKFKPALQQHHPVGIWVAWPLEFSLQS